MKVLLVFPNRVQRNFKDIEAGIAPKERLYGFYELMKNPDYTILDSDSRFEGLSNKVIPFLRGYGINLVDLKTVFKIAKVDVVVVKDNVSSMVSAVAALFGKPVVYYDSLFPIPQMKIKQFFLKRCLASCTRIVGYNHQQVEDYEQKLGLSLLPKYKHLEFLLDEEFYNSVFDNAPEPTEHDYLLSIGRDVGRDFATLVKASEQTGVKVKIVTLPYLLNGITLPDNVEILQNISYEALFTLYKGARGVVVPLKKGLSYASGIRAIMESLVLKKPSIVSNTPFVENNCLDYPNIIPVDPENVAQMVAAIEHVYRSDDNLDEYESELPSYAQTHREISQMLAELR